MRGPLIPKRAVLVLNTFLLSVLLYIDRICISVAKDPISQDLGFTTTQMGWVLSAFALGYALFQTPSGHLADRLGPRKVLTAVVTFWSIFTALTGAVVNFVQMLLVRFLFGAGEAGAFPGIARAVFSWIPMKERGIVQGINFSGSRLGAAFALPFVAWLIHSFGWRGSFLILGIIGIAWACFWYIWFRNDPAEHRSISDAEKDYILSNRQTSSADQVSSLSVKSLLHSKNMWLAMAQYFCSNFTFFFCLTWLFPHIKSAYQLDSLHAAGYSSLPLIFGAMGNWFSGFLVDRIYANDKWTLSRRLPAIIGFSLAAIGLVVSVYMTTALGAVIFLSLAIFGADMTLSPSWSFCIDIGKKHSGVVSGTMNMAGNLGSFITALAFPYLQVWTQSTTTFFFVGAILNAIAVFLWMRMRPEKSLEEW